MADSGPTTLYFAGVNDAGGTVTPHLIRVTDDLDKSLSQQFVKQADDFLKDDYELVDYQPKVNYRLEREQVFVIRQLDLPDPYVEAAKKPQQAPDFAPSVRPLPMISTVYAAEMSGAKPSRFLFQQFRSTQLLVNRMSIIFASGTFSQLRNEGLSLSNELVAIYQAKTLYFRSFPIVSRFIDLPDYEPEASDTEISEFLGSALFDLEDVGETFTIIEGDAWLRRRVASIQGNKILSRVKPRTAANKAKPFGITIDVSRPDGTDKIRLPQEKAPLKKVVKFLNEEFYHGELTRTMYETNSHQPHKVKKK